MSKQISSRRSYKKMNHEEYIQKVRLKIGVMAQGMIEGNFHYLEGAVELAKLRFESELEKDEDLLVFAGIDSEIDNLPVGNARQKWSADALERHEPEIQETIEWAKKISLENCKSLAARFNV